MSKIVLEIDDKNLSTVKTILENLKKDLIKNIKYEEIKEKNIPTAGSKYMSTSAYKARLKTTKSPK